MAGDVHCSGLSVSGEFCVEVEDGLHRFRGSFALHSTRGSSYQGV